MAGRIKRQCLRVGGPCSRVAAFEVEGAGAGESEGPAGFYRAGNDWKNKNMPYICGTLYR